MHFNDTLIAYGKVNSTQSGRTSKLPNCEKPDPLLLKKITRIHCGTWHQAHAHFDTLRDMNVFIIWLSFFHSLQSLSCNTISHYCPFEAECYLTHLCLFLFTTFRYGTIISTKAILDKTTNKCKGIFFFTILIIILFMCVFV